MGYGDLQFGSLHCFVDAETHRSLRAMATADAGDVVARASPDRARRSDWHYPLQTPRTPAFQNTIAGQAAINQEKAVTEKRAGLIESSSLAALDTELKKVSEETASSEARAQTLEDEFHKESDGTGGSRRYGYSEVARVKQEAAVDARQQVTTLQERLRQIQGERDKVDAQINQEVNAFRDNLDDDFLTRMKALSDLTASSNAVWWISTFVVFLLVGVEITPVVVKLLSPIGPYDVKLDAMNSVETNEALLKRDTTNRILAYHYGHVETAERQCRRRFDGYPHDHG